MVVRAHWVQQQAMKESGTVIRIDLDFKNAFNSVEHSCLWAIPRGLGVPDVDFLEELYSKSWMKITVGTGCSLRPPYNLIREQYRVRSSPPSFLTCSSTHSYGCWTLLE